MLCVPSAPATHIAVTGHSKGVLRLLQVHRSQSPDDQECSEILDYSTTLGSEINSEIYYLFLKYSLKNINLTTTR